MRQMSLVNPCIFAMQYAMTIKQKAPKFSKKMNEYAYIAGILSLIRFVLGQNWDV